MGEVSVLVSDSRSHIKHEEALINMVRSHFMNRFIFAVYCHPSNFRSSLVSLQTSALANIISDALDIPYLVYRGTEILRLPWQKWYGNISRWRRSSFNVSESSKAKWSYLSAFLQTEISTGLMLVTKVLLMALSSCCLVTRLKPLLPSPLFCWNLISRTCYGITNNERRSTVGLCSVSVRYIRA